MEPEQPPATWVTAVIAIAHVLARFCMALFLVGQNAAVLWLVLTHKVTADKDMIIAIVNGAGILAGTGVQYYLGSSASSAAKDRSSVR